jgi:hypothetical protein
MILGASLAVSGLAGCARVSPASSPSQSSRTASAESPAVALVATQSGVLLDYAGPKEFLQERCDQLAQHFPGVEELRLKNDNTIESRQWMLVADGSAPRWALALARNAPCDGWSPKPGIAKLHFVPPLEQQLAKKDDQFLAYAWLEGDSYEEMQKMGSLTTAFGDSQGTFEWQGRRYGYALSPRLPSFPWLQTYPAPRASGG